MDTPEEIRMCAKDHQTCSVVGLKHLISDIGFKNVDTGHVARLSHTYMTIDYSDAHYLGGHTTLLYQALSDSSFDKRIMNMRLRNKGTTGAWSLP
jgi:hypothetical protein